MKDTILWSNFKYIHNNYNLYDHSLNIDCISYNSNIYVYLLNEQLKERKSVNQQLEIFQIVGYLTRLI